MIHYFNPWHETAIFCASKYYQPKTNIVKMQQQLSYLPLWYANSNDFALVETLDKHFIDTLQSLCPTAQPISISLLAEKQFDIFNQRVEFWGISPSTIYRFERLNTIYGLNLQIPGWTDKLRLLGSRLTAHNILAYLIETISSISSNLLPHFFINMEEIKNFVIKSKEKLLLKAPYSSSGRGLVWLPIGEIAFSQKQIIGGILKKQGYISLEKVLDKQLDFSMNFIITSLNSASFIGYSIFYTDSKGAYKSSLLANQEDLEQQIISFVTKKLLYRVRNKLMQVLQKTYAPYYNGNISVDMLIYRYKNNYYLHPCVEINMRKSMGYLSIYLQRKFLSPKTKGLFSVDYHRLSNSVQQMNCELAEKYPLIIEGGKILSGYLSLCPITEESHYHAYLKAES